MVKGILFVTGFGISVVGGISIVAYMNLFATGLSLMEFLFFLLSRPECYLLPIGMILVAFSIYLSGNPNPSFRDKE
ncbi:hypothetical protein ACQCU1_08840 [Sutcliffiella horikoshii]|uniref:Uncharacterized protein n=1 Tax=Sutcliffiella horikoshii TaxID=79883 RepID=A0A1Y0CKG6_9BACI|nr:hypothetical protein [Sutcliffiella horikoshii]ART75798.1 hypothetical protein B4U37_07035 [Sutcliffiella horikoshii]TYS61075.1 hypothetical protein FZC74_02020 [Sutcliffiella horikoshii]